MKSSDPRDAHFASPTNDVTRLLAAHRESGRRFTAAGVSSFVLDQGAPDAEPVVCIHGVPASAYLYRKVVPALAARSLRGIAIDLPGLGLAERPDDFDYSWTGLGRWMRAAVDALNLDRFHLVVHDIGGPIGFELATADPKRVLSMTMLNTFVAAETFHRPWVMEPFAHPRIGEAWLQALRIPGVSRHVPTAEIAAYVPLLFGDDGGKAFLKIMRGFELTAEKQRRYVAAVRSPDYPVQIVWGQRDTALRWRHHGIQAQLAAGLNDAILLPGKHFLQEEFADDIACAVNRLIGQRNQPRPTSYRRGG
jgi:pimeloyl-ACP methyl ester carboxylesterase